MNKHTRFMVLLAAALLVLLALAALAAPAASQTAPPAAPAPRDGPPFVVPSALAGGGYELTLRGWRVMGYLQGGGYRVGERPSDDSGCCCKAHIPCQMSSP